MDYPDVHEFETTLAKVCLQAFKRSPDRVLLRYFNEQTRPTGQNRQTNESWSISDIMQRASEYALQLTQMDVEPGDVVAVMLDNHPDHVAVMIALGLTGAVWLPLNARFTASNVRRVLSQVESTLVIAESSYAGTLHDAGYNGRLLTPGNIADQKDRDRDALEQKLESLVSTTDGSPDDTRALLFTSGTTGPPKGVVVTERMYIASALFCGHASDADNTAIFYLWEPLNHIGGAQIIPMALLSGCSIAMTQRFSASRFWAEVVAANATRIHYLGGILELLLRQPPSQNDTRHAVKLGFGAGANERISTSFTTRFGIPLREVYGMTEASSFTTMNFDGPLDSIGKMLPDFDLKLTDGDFREVAAGDIGEICVKPNRCALVTPSYYQNPTATQSAFREGFLRTGDLACQDSSGNLYFVGRKTEQIRCKGENVSPWEIESVFKQHSAVLEVAVVGVDSEVTEQDIAAFVRLVETDSDQHAATVTDIQHLLATELANFQQPRYVVEVSDFPKTPSERIEKHKLDCSAEVLKGSW